MERVILHIDGDSFFASCEISLDPSLKGKPVVTGQERGIATAMSKEAKELGIFRGMPVFQIKKLFPEVIVTHSHYGSYGIFAQRMYDIVRRYTPIVEEYSIDECFADLTGLIGQNRASNEVYTSPNKPSKEDKLALGRTIKEVLSKELGMTFSVGIGPTKVLAKVASKHHKPDGLTVIEPDEIKKFLKDHSIGKVWGVGPQTTRDIQKYGIQTTLEFIEKPIDWIEANFARPYVEIYKELRGTLVHEIEDKLDDDYKSLQKTRTFSPVSSNKQIVFRELSRNVELACAKARRHNLSTKRIYYFLKTNEFRYHRKEIALVNPLSNPNDILVEIKKTFDEVYRPNTIYRATGITLSELISTDHVQRDLFGASCRLDAWGKVFETLDNIDKRYGSRTMILGSSLIKKEKVNLEKNLEIQKSDKNEKSPISNIYKKKFRIPYMGEVM